jgi:hypothetical protein
MLELVQEHCNRAGADRPTTKMFREMGDRKSNSEVETAIVCNTQ